MNRLWIGIALLVLLPVVGFGMMWGNVSFFGALSREVDACEEAALAENWTLVAEKAAQCREKWEKYCHFWASVTDHAPIEQMNTLFSQLELYENRRKAVEFAACCRAIATQMEAIRESHSLAWWNIL